MKNKIVINTIITLLALSLLPIGIFIGIEYSDLSYWKRIKAMEQTALEQQVALFGSVMREMTLKRDYEIIVSNIAYRLDNPIIVEKIVEKPVAIYVDRYTNTIISFNPIATPEELARAKEAIQYGRWSHQQFVDNPGGQNIHSGGTEFNIYWVENYDLFRELIERAYGKGSKK